ncbi:MAG: hypothetical protein NZ602_02135, partial [Thermoguttaceae bacterium]|nr:hypothetical protein [Thermoguttaceae bacterium]MDW8039166.1 nitrilase-related carbon-nitrogen hydrolase [Thermoguttaceae bacterium]
VPQYARDSVAAGADVLVSLINGSAFENPLALEQHFQLSLLRAVENRRSFIRCAGTGVSAIVDPTGHIRDRLPTQTEGVLVGEVPLVEGRTIYSKIGYLFSPCCFWLSVAALLFALASRGRRWAYRGTEHLASDRSQQMN